MANERRYGILKVDADALLGLLKPGALRNLQLLEGTALPADATFVRAGHDGFGLIVLVIESQSYAPVPLGDEIPAVIPPKFQAVPR